MGSLYYLNLNGVVCEVAGDNLHLSYQTTPFIIKMEQKETKEKLEKFRRYLVRQNFNGSMGYLKKNILRNFDDTFWMELLK